MSGDRKFALIIYLRPGAVIEHTDQGLVIERSERRCIRDRSGCGRAERELVNRTDGGRSRRAGSERGCIMNTARTQRGLIRD